MTEQIVLTLPGERALHGRCAAEPVARPHVGGEEAAAVFEDDRPQRRALREGEMLPHRFEEHLMFGEQPLERLMQVVEGHVFACACCWLRITPDPRYVKSGAGGKWG